MSSPSSASEGEIVEMDIDKANYIPQVDGTRSVDHPTRTRSPYSRSSRASVETDRSDHRYRSRSPRPRSPHQGEKRRREDNFHYSRDRNRHDSRHFHVHFEDRSGSRNYSHRSQVSYADIDRGDPLSVRRDDRSGRDRYRDKRQRVRSRSPTYQERNRYSDRDRYDSRNSSDRRQHRDSRRADDDFRRHYKGQSMSERGVTPTEARSSKQLAETRTNGLQDVNDSQSRHRDSPHENENGNPADEPEDEPAPVDENALMEERRRKREALRQALKGKNLSLEMSGGSSSATPAIQTPTSEKARSASPMTTTSNNSRRNSQPDLAMDLTVKTDEDLANDAQHVLASREGDGPSAADYDPRADMEEDKQRHDKHHADGLSAADYDDSKADDRNLLIPETQTEAEPTQEAEKELDMFADDDDDMFAPEPAVKKSNRPIPALSATQRKDKTLLDNWDDPDGYYIITPGEMLGQRYRIQSNLGKGMFSSVVRAQDEHSNGRLVAIKIIRNNETMRKAALKEIGIIQKLAAADPEDKKHVIRLEGNFEHGGHVCMVFENLSINLREVLKKFGRDVGINLKAVRSYAHQMFLGLSLLRKCNILHADLKPDNILVNDGRNILKICDLGSASDASDSQITQYLVSRFYRAPEIILGMTPDYAIDMWSIGCTLYELYTGKILFTGRNNNQMLRSMMECRGRFTSKMLRKCAYAPDYFDHNMNFKSLEKDRITGRDVVRTINMNKPTRDLKTRLVTSAKGLTAAELKEVNLFVDLLDQCLALNPEKRCTPTEALKHPFISRPKT